MNSLNVLGFQISSWIVIPIIFLLWVILFLYIKRIVFGAVRKFAKNTETKFDDVFVKAADFPITLLTFTSGGAVVEMLLPAATNAELTQYFLVGFKAATIVAVVLFVDRFATGLIQAYSNKVDVLRSTGGIVRGLVRILVIGLGVLILLDSFGISITPLIASLGIGSLAVALALQPTLENFFAGIQLLIDKPIKVGHFVKLESGEEGYVHKIGWRSTWVRMLPNNIVVMPNSSIVKAKIVNYYYPDRQMAVLVQVGVHYDSDLEQVEKVTIEVARETMQEVEGAVKDFEPFIRFHTFADFSINFSVIMRAEEFVANYLIKHEFIKKLHKRYAKEGITIPYPIRAINYEQEGVEKA